MNQPYDALIPAPFGAVGVVVRDDYVVSVQLLPPPAPFVEMPTKGAKNPFTQQVIHQITEYLAQPSVPLDTPYAVHGTPFQRRVWQAIREIPCGQTLTYGELAQRVGSGPRAVANACGANQVPLVIPCHRVVAKHGLGGFMQGIEGGIAIKQWLLAHEAVNSHA